MRNKEFLGSLSGLWKELLQMRGWELTLHQSHNKRASEGPFKREERVNKNILCVKKKMKKTNTAYGYQGQIMERNLGFGVRKTQVRIPSLSSCVTVYQFLNLSEPQLSHLQNGDKSTCWTELLWRWERRRMWRAQHGMERRAQQRRLTYYGMCTDKQEN